MTVCINLCLSATSFEAGNRKTYFCKASSALDPAVFCAIFDLLMESSQYLDLPEDLEGSANKLTNEAVKV